MQRREVRWELMFPDELEALVAEFPHLLHALRPVRIAQDAEGAGL